MKYELFSYRFAKEILQHEKYKLAWDEIIGVVEDCPLYLYRDKSKKNKNLDVVQQLMNCYFDRRFVIDFGWKYHPLATSIISSGLAADFSKKFSDLTIQTEVQFGNMARWYSDIFKFQAAYSQSLIQVGLCIVPKASLAKRIDSNVVNFERVVRELPAAELSITLPILVLGIEADDDTTTFDVAKCNFPDLGKITGRGNAENLWRVVNAQIAGTPSHDVGENLEVGPMLTDTIAEED